MASSRLTACAPNRENGCGRDCQGLDHGLNVRRAPFRLTAGPGRERRRRDWLAVLPDGGRDMGYQRAP